MTDERAKEIAEDLRRMDNADPLGLTADRQLLLKLYDDVQALKSALSGLAFLGIGGSIKRGGE